MHKENKSKCELLSLARLSRLDWKEFINDKEKTEEMEKDINLLIEFAQVLSECGWEDGQELMPLDFKLYLDDDIENNTDNSCLKKDYVVPCVITK